MRVPTPAQITEGTEGIYRPGMATGTAQALPMTQEQADRVPPRLPFGFQPPDPQDELTCLYRTSFQVPQWINPHK